MLSLVYYFQVIYFITIRQSSFMTEDASVESQCKYATCLKQLLPSNMNNRKLADDLWCNTIMGQSKSRVFTTR